MATIVSFSDLKSMLELTKDSFTDYPSLKVIADQVHSDLESYTGRKLNTVSKLTESGITIGKESFINLKNIPIVSVSSIIVDGVTLTVDTDYTVNNYGISLITARDGSYTIVTKGGFKNIPEEIYRAEMSQIIYEWQNRNNLAAKNFTNDGGSVSLPGFEILNHVKEMLSSYVHIEKSGY